MNGIIWKEAQKELLEEIENEVNLSKGNWVHLGEGELKCLDCSCIAGVYSFQLRRGQINEACHILRGFVYTKLFSFIFQNSNHTKLK